MMKQALTYSLKVWLTGVMLTLMGLGTIYCNTMASRGYNVTVSLIAYAELVFIELALTFPLFLLFVSVVYFTNNTLLTITIQKVLLSLIACALIALLLLTLHLLYNEQLMDWMKLLPNHFPIVIVTLASIWFYNLKPLKQQKRSV